MKKIIEGLLSPVEHFFSACRYSFAGVKSCAKTEPAFRQELFLGLAHFAAVWVLPVSLLQALMLSVLWCGILAAELLNTAIEAIVDLASPSYHDLAKKAKDTASASVGVMLVAYLASWCVVLLMKR